MPIFNVFHKLTAKDLACDRKGDVVTLKTTDSVEKAVKVLCDSGVLAAPVVDANGDLVGFVDRVDIASFIADAAPDDSELKRDELQSLQIAGRAIALVSLDQVVNRSGKDALLSVFESSPASEVLEFFASGQHRCVLFSADKEIASVVSQSNFVAHMADNLQFGATKEIAAKKLSELGFEQGHMSLTTIRADQSVLQATKVMKREGVSALAVVDPKGKLVGNFSASDLKGLFRQRLPDFLKSVEQFLKDHSPASLEPVTGSKDATLQDTCKLLAGRRLHHVFLVSEENVPYGLISQTDIMKIAAANRE